MITFQFLEQTLTVMPERALYWHEQRTLVVADVHFGKDATFRSAGIALPLGGTAANLTQLSSALSKCRAERLLILGDLIHAKAGRSEQMIDAVTSWRADHSELFVELVKGNHDLHAGNPPLSWDIAVHGGVKMEGPFVWQHEPEASTAGYAIGGHVHPAVSLSGWGDKVRLPCFWFGRNNAILPAFGDFTGFGTVSRAKAIHLFVIADGEVIQVPC